MVKCDAPVQVRFAGSAPKVVRCGKPGSTYPSLLFDSVSYCDEHFEYYRHRRRFDPVVEDPKLNHMSFELPIPGVW